MNDSQQLPVAACALGFYGVGQVWLAQLSSYALWTYVGEREFGAYHRHRLRVGVVTAYGLLGFWMLAQSVWRA